MKHAAKPGRTRSAISVKLTLCAEARPPGLSRGIDVHRLRYVAASPSRLSRYLVLLHTFSGVLKLRQAASARSAFAFTRRQAHFYFEPEEWEVPPVLCMPVLPDVFGTSVFFVPSEPEARSSALTSARVVLVPFVDGVVGVSVFFVPCEPEARSSALTSARVVPVPFVDGVVGVSIFFVPADPVARSSALTSARVLDADGSLLVDVCANVVGIARIAAERTRTSFMMSLFFTALTAPVKTASLV